MKKLKILVVEDEKLAQKIIANHLKGHILDFAADKISAEKKMKVQNYDLCFLDLNLGDGELYSGLNLIPLASSRGIYSVVMTGSTDSEEIISKAYELGCKDFYSKGNEEKSVNAVLRKFLKSAELSSEVFANEFISRDKETINSIKETLRYAPTDIPVLILGPSGSGKTSLAQIIHKHSGRKGSFVSINCSAYAQDLLEAELFGYKKGAFTGAYENKKGKLLEANGGTLFLDEIGSMSLDMQTKLLKAIEEKIFYPLGSSKPEHSDFRIISATLEDLQKLFSSGKLRFDFFQRIHGLTVKLKPLKNRKCDIFTLIRNFTGKSKRLSFYDEAKDFLENYAWPGNIRELKRFVDLASCGTEGKINLRQVKKLLNQAITSQSNPAAFITEGQYRHAVENGLMETLRLFASEIIKRNLSENGGKKTETMKELGISTRFFYSSLKNQKTK